MLSPPAWVKGAAAPEALGLHRAQGEPALHRVQVELVPVDHQGQGSRAKAAVTSRASSRTRIFGFWEADACFVV